MNEIYEVEINEGDGAPTRSFPAYTCGHCTSIILMRPDRTRDRRTCLSCGRWTCEKNEVCLSHCTPMHAMVKDHFENVGEHGKYVQAIMNGIVKKDDADQFNDQRLLISRGNN